MEEYYDFAGVLDDFELTPEQLKEIMESDAFPKIPLRRLPEYEDKTT